MNKFCIYIAGALALLATSDGTAAADRESSEQVIVVIMFSEGPSAVGESKILAEPTFAVTLARPFSFHVGGKLNARNGEGAIEIGTRVRGTITKREGDSLLVTIQLAVGHPVRDASDPDTELVQTEMLDLRTTMTVGQKKRIKCGRSGILEIHIKPTSTTDDET